MEPLALARRVGDELDRLGIAWVLGGSLASSLVGEPRSTMDIDLAVALEAHAVDSLVSAFEGSFYVSVEMARYAATHASSFNLLDLASAYKVDLFVLGDGELDRLQIATRRTVTVDLASRPVEFWVGAPEVQILRKLQWYRQGGEVSDRQWRDVIAILRVQGSLLDHAEMSAIAERIGLADLLARAELDADAS